jgi:hypothetical protein
LLVFNQNTLEDEMSDKTHVDGQTNRGLIVAAIITATGTIVAAGLYLLNSPSLPPPVTTTSQQAPSVPIVNNVSVNTNQIAPKAPVEQNPVVQTVVVVHTVVVKETVVIRETVEPQIQTVIVTAPPLPSGAPSVVSRVASGDPVVLDLSSYQVGDIAEQLGQGLVIRVDQGEKYIGTRSKLAYLQMDGLRHSGNFEARLDIDAHDSNLKIEFLTESGKTVEFLLTANGWLRFGETRKFFAETSWNGNRGIPKNNFRFVFGDSIVKLFINGEDGFFATIEIPSAEVFTQLRISGLVERSKIYAVRFSPL